MPTDVTMPDGAVITNVPDGTTKAQLQAKYGAHLAQTQPNTAVDIARSIPGGFAKGAASIAGLPGDVASFERDPANYETATPWLHRAAAAINPAHWLPTSSTIANTVAAPFGGFYKPKTTAGEYAETTASFAPSALAPGSLLQRGARVVVPSVASETAGQLTKGTPYEPYARTVAALASGVGVGAAEGIAAERAQTARTPTTEHLFQAGGHEYTRVGGTPVALNQQFMDALQGPYGRQAIETALEGADANRRAALMAEFNSLLGPTPPTHISANAAEAIRRAFGTRSRQIMRGTEPNEDVVAGLYRRQADVDSVLAQVPEIQDARHIWGTAERGQIIDDAIEAARRSSGTPGGFGDAAQALRREFLALTRSRDFERFLPAEQHAIEAVANGTLTTNILQQLGKFSPVRGHITRWLELGGAMAGHGPEALAVAAGGELARQGSHFATARAARRASETVRSGGPVAPQLAAPVLREGTRALILANPARLNDSYAARVNALAAGP